MSDIIEVVASDLKFLQDEWNDSIDDHSLRRSSSILRRLLLHGDLQKAWLALGFKKEPRIKASTLTPLFNTLPKETINFASAGGANYKGTELMGTLLVNFVMNESQINKCYSQGIPQEILGLRAFTEAPSLVINGKEISRGKIIKFVANKLGGDHFDEKRGGDKDEQLFTLLDIVLKEVKLADKNAIYFELLSAGQALINAPDIKKFMEKAKEKGFFT